MKDTVKVRQMLPILKNSGKTVWVYDRRKELIWGGMPECIPDRLLDYIVTNFSAIENSAIIVAE